MFPSNLTVYSNNAKNIYRSQKYPVSNTVKFATFDIQSKITRRTKKQENMIHNEEKYQSIERDSKKQIRELAGKDPKMVTAVTFHIVKKLKKIEHVR